MYRLRQNAVLRARCEFERRHEVKVYKVGVSKKKIVGFGGKVKLKVTAYNVWKCKKNFVLRSTYSEIVCYET